MDINCYKLCLSCDKHAQLLMSGLLNFVPWNLVPRIITSSQGSLFIMSYWTKKMTSNFQVPIVVWLVSNTRSSPFSWTNESWGLNNPADCVFGSMSQKTVEFFWKKQVFVRMLTWCFSNARDRQFAIYRILFMKIWKSYPHTLVTLHRILWLTETN